MQLNEPLNRNLCLFGTKPKKNIHKLYKDGRIKKNKFDICRPITLKEDLGCLYNLMA